MIPLTKIKIGDSLQNFSATAPFVQRKELSKEHSVAKWLMDGLPVEFRLHLLQSFDQPERLREFWEKHFVGDWHLHHGGRSEFNFHNYFHSILASLDPAVFTQDASRELSDGLSRDRCRRWPHEVEKVSYSSFPEEEWSWVGRTRVRKKADGRLDCVKFQSANEKSEALSQEFSATEFLRAAKRMKSEIPRPVRLLQIVDIPDQAPKTIKQENPCAYQYDAPGNYFDYLPAQKDLQVFKKGLYLWLEDSITLIKSNVYHVSTDLYHSDSRHYLPGMAMIDRYKTAGSIEKPLKGVSFPNAGAGGGRDWGDLKFLSDYIRHAEHLGDKIMGALNNEKFPIAVHASELSKLLLVSALMMCERMRRMGALDWENSDQVGQLSTGLKEAFAFLLHCYVSAPFDQSLAYAEKGPIDWEMAAKEWLFWSNEEKYLPWLLQGKLPCGLYRKGLNIVVNPELDVKKAMNFTKEKGYRTGDELDIGAYNGPSPLVEFELAVNLFTSLAMALRNQLEKLAPP